MKDYFIRLFEYDKYANELLCKSIINNNSPKEPVRLMAHMLGAQQIWLNRCCRQPATGGAIWPDWQADTFAEMIADNSRNWLEFVNILNPEDFNTLISYQNSRGESFTNKLIDIMAHVINHGTHHRAQAGQWLKLQGLEKLPVTDYILYIREHKPEL